jgi:hypothetical protein
MHLNILSNNLFSGKSTISFSTLSNIIIRIRKNTTKKAAIFLDLIILELIDSIFQIPDIGALNQFSVCEVFAVLLLVLFINDSHV